MTDVCVINVLDKCPLNSCFSHGSVLRQAKASSLESKHTAQFLVNEAHSATLAPEPVAGIVAFKEPLNWEMRIGTG
jgi:hypothetical protein